MNPIQKGITYLTILGMTATPLIAAKKADLFLYGNLGSRSLSGLNTEVGKISDGAGFGGLGYGGGADLTFRLKHGFGLGFGAGFRSFGTIDTYLNGLDGTRINTGSVGLNTVDGHLILQKLFGKENFQIGPYIEPGMLYDMVSQKLGDKTFNDNAMRAKVDVGMYMKVAKYFGLKAGYDFLNKEFRGEVGGNIPFGK